MKTLILYYSYGGNTRKIAQMIQREMGGDLAEIETVKPYTGSYNEVVNQGQDEVRSGYMPAIKSLNLDLSSYDKVVLGSPVWWYTFAPAMNTFLHENSLAGKTIYPFATNGGWIGHIFKDFKAVCSEAEVMEGLNVRFNEKHQVTSDAEIKKWIQNI